ncbi:hypothetical protein GNI_076710 [Gregarina niphandrodes]|uniref:Uncharacterized protein n=1 Tax=Gregarina niphandrodes TaxID=110365 RepID=A0A023B6S4_GRENI|nr:hypothetical protein GNI_076710 [Gregarina niphandrodes]EZG66734.1 hypothetical protein GNI_076710 [Gregarina niphandrodes]|eukprot:XP_011130506.1 hypothetical protein GNI_076710 [Gregarina niphandrodes]
MTFSPAGDVLMGDAESCVDAEDLAACLLSLGPSAEFSYIRTGALMATGSARCSGDERRLLHAELEPFALQSPMAQAAKLMPPAQFVLTDLTTETKAGRCTPLAYILSPAQDCQDDHNAAIELTVTTDDDDPNNRIYSAPELSNEVSTSRQLLIDVNDCGTVNSTGFLLYEMIHYPSSDAPDPDSDHETNHAHHTQLAPATALAAVLTATLPF